MEGTGSPPPASPPPARDDEASGAGPPVRRPGPPRPVSAAELERIIRRASDLQFRAGASEGAAVLDEAEVVRIGEEVGLEPRYVRQALAEVHAESLVPSLPADSPFAARLWGPGLVRASRVVPGDRTEVEAKLHAHLRDGELLKQVRARPGRSLWQPAGGLLSTMKRAMDVAGRGYELAKARSVDLSVEPLEPGRSLVTFTADLRNLRKDAAVGFHVAFGAAAVPLAVFLVASSGAGLPLLLGTGAAGSAGLAGANWAAAAHTRKRRERTELALQGILDRVEGGEAVGSGGRRWKGRLPGARDRRDRLPRT